MMTDWKRKLAAYLHDPPSKCADLATHDQRSERALRAAGFSEDELRAFAKQADLTASSADRFPFPGSRSAGMSCVFDGVRAGFHHPLGGEAPHHRAVLAFEAGQEVTGFDVIEGELEEGEQTVQPVLNHIPSDWSDDYKWRARFFAHWRLWPQFAAERDARFAFLPADTRMPDHTIWTHNAVVAALASCADLGEGPTPTNPEELASAMRRAPLRPAFLKFQLGPVQEFIAQARSTRDLWSGSYLLSWLMASGLKALSAEVGPDAVIYPNLRSQPLFDLQWKNDLWDHVCIGDKPVWKSLRERAHRARHENIANNPDLDLLTPNLPNVFFALVPEKEAAALGNLVAQAIRKEWEAIRDSVWRKVEDSGLLQLCPESLGGEKAHERFVAQTDRLLSVSWHAIAWPKTLAEARQLAACLPAEASVEGEQTLLKRFDAVVNAASQAMPRDHRDPRYYVGGENGPKDILNNIGLGWALISAVNGWCLDATRRSRVFPAWSAGGWQEVGVAQSKDALTGREEMLFGGSGFTERLSNLEKLKDGEEWRRLFKHDDEVGATTLVKRVWHWTYLGGDKWKLRARRGQFPMPNTRGIAGHDPFAQEPEDNAEEDVEQIGDEAVGGRYFAVLTLDGDSIGKWVSGDNCPRYQTQLAEYWDSTHTQRQGSLEYFIRDSDPDDQGALNERYAELLDTRRLVSPSYHLQFSESLSNFALLCARPIVEVFDGRLIYAGGDDLVALLPADTALACARALRGAFQGSEVRGSDDRILFRRPVPGFLTSERWKDDRGRPIPFLVPGPAADCSVGIAIAHFKAPLQDVVRAAQAAEKRAKVELGRSAVAVTLMKRSGETIEWGCQWTSSGLEAYAKMLAALQGGVVSAKFPHRIVELVDGYQINEPGKLGGMKPADGFNKVVNEILEREVATAAERQKGANYSREKVHGIEKAIGAYLNFFGDAGLKVRALIGLCQTVAFIERNPHEKAPETRIPKSEIETTPAERQPVL